MVYGAGCRVQGADRLGDEARSLAEREEGVVLPVPERRHVPGRLFSSHGQGMSTSAQVKLGVSLLID